MYEERKIIYNPDKYVGSGELSDLKSPLRLKPGPLVELKTCIMLACTDKRRAALVYYAYNFIDLLRDTITQLSGVFLNLV